jgi:hypothetical protein
MMNEPSKHTRMELRAPTNLAQTIRERAHRSHRSVNQYVCDALEAYCELDILEEKGGASPKTLYELFIGVPPPDWEEDGIQQGRG